MNQITILQHLRKPKAVLEVIIATPTWDVNILQLSKPTANTSRRINRHKSIPCPVPVHLIARRSVSVVETLDDFRTKDVVAVRDKETSLLVESSLVSRGCGVVWVIGRSAVSDPAENFGADACSSTRVGIFAAFDELKTEIDVFLFLECETAEDE